MADENNLFAGAPKEGEYTAEPPAQPAVEPGQEVPPELAPKPRFVPQGVPRETPREEPGFIQGALEGAGAGVAGAAETGEAVVNRLRGRPLAEPTESPLSRPEVAELPPSEGWRNPYWWGQMLGRGAPAMAAYGLTGGVLGGMFASGLTQFITEYGPAFRANVEAGIPEDQALRGALQSSGVSAAATAAMFGLPLKVFVQVLGQPTIGAGAQVLQNYLAGLPPEKAFQGAGEAALAGAIGAAPVVAGKVAGRIFRGKPEAPPKPQAEAPPAKPPAEPPGEPKAPTAAGEDLFAGAPREPGFPGTAPSSEAQEPPAAPPSTTPSLFDWAVMGGEGEPPTPPTVPMAAAAAPRVPVRPRVETPPRPIEPPAPAEPPRAREPVPAERPAAPSNLFEGAPREGEVGEPPPWVTERIPEIPEEAAPPAPPAPEPRGRVPEIPEEPPRAREPRQSLLDFIRERGGISTKDPLIGDVRSVLGKVNPLIRRGGKSLDRLLEGAVEAGYIEDPGFRGGGERTSTIADLIDAMDRDQRARAAGNTEGRVWARGEEVAAGRAPSEYEAGVEATATRIRDELAKAGVRGEGVDTETLYRAAESLYRGDVRSPLDAYDRAAVEIAERDYAQRSGVRPGGEEVPEAGKPRAGPRVEKAIPAARQEPPGARPARPSPRQEVSREDLIHLQDTWEDKLGPGHRVNALDSVPLATALKELDVRHLTGVPRTVADWVRNRLGRLVGDTPVHFITDRDMRRYFPELPEGVRGTVGGVWVEANDRAGNRRSFILVNADVNADPRVGTHTILHEATHAAAYNNLEKKPELKHAIRLIMNETRERLGPKYRDIYAFTNEHEFLSEAFSNRALQEALSRIEAPANVARLFEVTGVTPKAPSSLWNSFVETVRRLIGAPRGATSMLETIMRVGEEAIGREEGAPVGRTEAAMAGEPRKFYDVRADPDKRVYQVVERSTGEVVASYKYGPKESERGVAHGRANIHRDRLNEQLRREAPMARPEEEPGAEGKPQLVMPGAEQRPGEALQRRAAAPMRAKAEQKAPGGMFDLQGRAEATAQQDLFGALGGRKEAPLIIDAGDEALTTKTYAGLLSRVPGAVGRLVPKAAPEWMHNFTEARVKTQDAFLRWRRAAEQWMRDNPGAVLPDEANPYQVEALSHGKIAERIDAAEEKYTKPLADEMARNGLTYEEFGEYAQAMHAEERNRELRRINPTLADPAGMSDAEAQRIKAAAAPRQAAFDAAWTRLRAMIDDTLDGMVRDGLIQAQVAADWRKRWPNYVPMRHTEVGDIMGVGRGVDIRGKESQQAFGRLSRADNPLQYALMQMQRAIVRGEKNQVGKAVDEFVRMNNEPDLWSTTEKPMYRYIDPKTGQVAEMVHPLWKQDPGIYIWKDNGIERHVYFKGEYGGKLIRALKNMEVKQAGEIVRAMAWTTRQLARMNTSLNPEFVISNFIRDAGEAFINLPADQQAGLVSSFRNHLIPALEGAWSGQDRVTLGSAHAQWYREFVEEGGKIGFYGAMEPETHAANFQKMLDRAQNGKLNTIKNMGKFVVEKIDEINTTVENATRLAVYIAARENGFSKPKAAFMAREATVNFNRRGESRALSAAYMFANAGLQGTVRGAQSLKNSPRARKAAAVMAASGAALTTYNIFAGGTAEDGQSNYSHIPAYRRELNFIFMDPSGSGSYIMVPKPFFFGMFAGAGDHLAQFVFDHRDAAKAASGIIWDSIKAVDPLGQDEGWAHFAPTILKPVSQLLLDKDAFGRTIYPEEQPWSKYKPKSEGFTLPGTSGAAKWAAKMLNELSGGDKKTPGYLDVHPEVLDYLTGFVTGGLGRFGMNMLSTGTRWYNGQEWQQERTPFVRRFYGESLTPGSMRALYRDQRMEVEAAAQRKTPGPEMRSAGAFRTAQKANSALYKQRDAIAANDKLSEAEKEQRIKKIDEQQLRNMMQARRVLERNRAAAEKRKPAFAVGGLVQI